MPTPKEHEIRNRLQSESSPYLLQHSDNPVHWQPWGEDTLQLAKDEGKPILLSIGYAACHWCHVMAHESFENEDIAGLMNSHFINIKVDREERPDLDNIYQTALALLGEQGGWPLTIFLTPDGEPFWGGTYFPPTPRYGRQGFPQILLGISNAFTQDRDKIENNVKALKDGLSQLSKTEKGAFVDDETRHSIAESITRHFDPFEGGLGSAPKFPQPAILKFLWRCWKRSNSQPMRNAVELTLTKMCQGGIYDHLGGGFARYSVDAHWLVPHFEKMLYDNAQMVQCLTWAWQDTGNPLYAVRVRETLNWVLHEMLAEDENGGKCGAFAASLDADSEGEEGKFYVWQEAEIDALLGEDSDFFKLAYDVKAGGNWEGKTILNRSQAPELKSDLDEKRLAANGQILFDHRKIRIPPGWDDKVLADWNGLMIVALVEAAMVFSEPSWLKAAITAFDFIDNSMQVVGRLNHSWRRGKLAHPASIDDYAFVIEAALMLYEATSEPRYLEKAETWAAITIEHYWDTEEGGFFFSADDTADLIVRSKIAQDNATPSGNGVMLASFVRLYAFTGKLEYLNRAENLFRAFSGAVPKQALGLTTLLAGSEFLEHMLQIVIIGEQSGSDTETLKKEVYRHCLPNRVLQIVSSGEELTTNHPAAGKTAIGGQATAYVCSGQSCSLPVTDTLALGALLS